MGWLEFLKEWFAKEPEKREYSGFVFSKGSSDRLKDVKPELRKVANLALKYSKIDFGITEGLRTKERQRKLVAEGASKTMRSKHITGDAVDVVAYIDGVVTWDFGYYTQIAEAFQKAAKELNIDIVWGGCWKSLLSDKTPTELLEIYKAECKAKRRKPFLDGVHYELR